MKPGIHIPGLPQSPEPPDLADLLLTIRHPDVVRAGITTTGDGRWALLIVVKQETKLPVEAVEEQAEGYPVIYQYDPGGLPVARPAYPELGE